MTQRSLRVRPSAALPVWVNPMTDFNTIERIARQLCEERGLDYDAKGRKQAHWLARARRIVAMAESHPVVETLARACGWRL